MSENASGDTFEDSSPAPFAVRLLRRRKSARNATRARPRTPPTAPPAIAPTFEWLDEFVDPLPELVLVGVTDVVDVLDVELPPAVAVDWWRVPVDSGAGWYKEKREPEAPTLDGREQ